MSSVFGIDRDAVSGLTDLFSVVDKQGAACGAELQWRRELAALYLADRCGFGSVGESAAWGRGTVACAAVVRRALQGEGVGVAGGGSAAADGVVGGSGGRCDVRVADGGSADECAVGGADSGRSVANGAKEDGCVGIDAGGDGVTPVLGVRCGASGVESGGFERRGGLRDGCGGDGFGELACGSRVGESQGFRGDEGVREESGVEVASKSASVPVEQERGKHYRRNKARRERAKVSRTGGVGAGMQQSEVPEWRRKVQGTVKTPSLSASVCTVDTRTAEEIEAARTLALRRTAENKVAVAVAQHRLMSLRNKEKTDALMRLQVAKIEEQVNTTRAKSQASYKKCGSPIESVGSAMSAGEFGWKQELRKRKALQTKLEYIEAQNMELCKYASAEGLRIVSQMPEPYIPTDEEIEAEDEDISPYPSMEEMRAHAAAMCGDDYPW